MGIEVIVDTETTSLRPDRRVWDLALIRREGGRRDEFQAFIDLGDLDIGNADWDSLRIGRFHERHPQVIGETGPMVMDEWEAAERIQRMTHDAVVWGNSPSFDMESFRAMLFATGSARSSTTGRCAWRRSRQVAHGRGDDVDTPWHAHRAIRRCGVEPRGWRVHYRPGDAWSAARRWSRAVSPQRHDRGSEPVA